MSKLEGRVALVTGGSGGIGSATLRRFVQEGAAVVCADIDEERGEEIVAELEDRMAAQLEATNALPDMGKLDLRYKELN